MSNPKAIGERTEGIILAHLLKQGYSVALPFGNNQRYDLIVDDGNALSKAQCKTARWVNGCIAFQACSKNGFTNERRGYKGQIDVFLVYSPDTDKVYKIPVEAVGSTEVALRVEEPKLKGAKTTIRWAKDFEI